MNKVEDLSDLEKRYCLSFKVIPDTRTGDKRSMKQIVQDAVDETVAQRGSIAQTMEMSTQQLMESDDQNHKDAVVTALTGIAMTEGLL